MVLDPFAGSATTSVVAEQLNRRWLGCELEAGYNGWAIERLEKVVRKSTVAWIEFDRATEERRNSIRVIRFG